MTMTTLQNVLDFVEEYGSALHDSNPRFDSELRVQRMRVQREHDVFDNVDAPGFA